MLVNQKNNVGNGEILSLEGNQYNYYYLLKLIPSISILETKEIVYTEEDIKKIESLVSEFNKKAKKVSNPKCITELYADLKDEGRTLEINIKLGSYGELSAPSRGLRTFSNLIRESSLRDKFIDSRGNVLTLIGRPISLKEEKEEVNDNTEKVNMSFEQALILEVLKKNNDLIEKNNDLIEKIMNLMEN